MPRESIDIESFSAGIILAADAGDIPPNAARWSENIDPSYMEGKLAGRPYDGILTSDWGKNLRKYSWLQRNGGEYDLVGFTHGGILNIVKDFYGTPVAATLEDLSADIPSPVAMQTHNGTVHIGLDDQAPLWVGYPSKGQFNGAVPTGPLSVEADLEAPKMAPAFYKAFYDATETSHFGIEWQGQFIYKVAASTGLWEASTVRFTKLQGICNYDATTLFVYDLTGNFGILHKVEKATLSILASYPLDGWYADGEYMGGEFSTPFAPLQCSDIECTTAKIWFAGYSALGIGCGDKTVDEGFLFNYTIASLVDGASFHPTNVTPDWNNAGSAEVAHFDSAWETNSATFIKRSLVRMGTGEIGFLITVLGEMYYDDAATGKMVMGSSIIFMNESMVTGDKVNSANCHLAKINSGLTECVKAGLMLFAPDTTKINGYDASPFTIANTAWDVSTGPNTMGADDTLTFPEPVTNAVISYIRTVSQTVTIAMFSGAPAFALATTTANNVSFNMATTYTYIRYSPVVMTLTADTTVPGTFSTDKHFYSIAFVYDDVQTSPLIPIVNVPSIEGSTLTGSKCVRVSIKLYDVADTISPRVTAIQLFHAEGPAGAATPLGYYRYVTEISVEKNWGGDTTLTATWGDAYTVVFYDDGVVGQSYEAATGIPESLVSLKVFYGISTQYAGYHFVGGCALYDGTEAARLVFRSKRNAFDMVNWSADFCVLPRIPKALVAWNGFIYAFAEGECYKIDSEGLFVVESFTNVGVINDNCVLVSSHGLFVLSPNALYFHDGTTFRNISHAVLHGDSAITGMVDFSTFLAASGMKSIAYHPELDLLLMSSPNGDIVDVYVYTPLRQRWDYWTFFGDGDSAGVLVAGTSNDVYYSNYSVFWKIASSAIRMPWSWYSQVFPFGRRDQKKRFYDAALSIAAGSPVATVAYDGGTFAAFVRAYAKTISVKIADTGVTGVVNTLSLMFRRMIGDR